jgi:hypothetical protein
MKVDHAVAKTSESKKSKSSKPGVIAEVAMDEENDEEDTQRYGDNDK